MDIDLALFGIVAMVLSVIWGVCASVARGSGKGSGFIWGFLLGPFGVIVAAVKGVGDRIEDLASATRLATAASPKAGNGKITVRSRHAEAAAQPRKEGASCPHCGEPCEPPDAPGTYACPHCGKGIAFE